MGLMCETLEVSRSGYYAWMKRGESERSRKDQELSSAIQAIHEGSGRRYGSPRIHAELARRDIRCGRKRVARLMHDGGLRAKGCRRFRPRTTDSRHDLPIAPNLVDRTFAASKPNRLWLADITYIPTREGWLYLASIIDVFSRMIVGWAMDSNRKTQLCLHALDMALRRRRPAPGMVHHSDRGSQYASKDYRKALKAKGIRCSMSAAGNCYDNALKESFFRSLKVELVHDEEFASHEQAKSAVFEYIESFYNRRRLHSALGYVPPMEFEELADVA